MATKSIASIIPYTFVSVSVHDQNPYRHTVCSDSERTRFRVYAHRNQLHQRVRTLDRVKYLKCMSETVVRTIYTTCLFLLCQ